MVSAPWLTVIVGPVMIILAPLPFWIYMPVSFTMIDAPVVLLSMIPPVGPGRSLIISEFCPAV